MALSGDETVDVVNYTVTGQNLTFSVLQEQQDDTPTLNIGYFLQQVIEGGGS